MYPALRRFAAAISSTDVDPDDLVQDALVGLLRAWPRQGIASPEAYLRRAILTGELSHRRRQARFRRLAPQLRAEPTTTPSYPSDLRILELVGPLDRSVLYLADVEGLSFAQVSAALNVSTAGALRLRASRARRRLRLLLEDQEGL